MPGVEPDNSSTLAKELRANSKASWLWSQATLVTAVISLPFLTHALPKPEFALWAQLLALSGITLLSDLGVGSVLVRRINEDVGNEEVYFAAANRFYLITGAVVIAVLVLVTFVPGGVLEPYIHVTTAPSLTALLVIGTVGTNFLLRAYRVVLLSRGQLAREWFFGAGPAVIGTILTVLAATIFHSALSVASAYALVELVFYSLLVVTVRKELKVPLGWRPTETFDWLGTLKESPSVLVLDALPYVVPFVHGALIARASGPDAAALYLLALKIAQLLRRFFLPLGQSIFVAVCRAGSGGNGVVTRSVSILPRVALSVGLGASLMSLPLGNSILRGVFGEGYGSASAALTLLVLASTAQTIVLTGLKTLQAEARLGHIPTVLVASFLAHSTLTLLLSKEWPLGGPAGALLGATLLIEMPVILRQLLQRLPESKIFVPGLLRVFIRETLLFYAGTILVIILLSRGNLSPALNWILSIAGASLIGFAVLELAKYFRFTDRQNASTVGVASDPNFKSINYKEEQIEDTWLD